MILNKIWQVFFTSDHLNRFISFHNLIKEKNTRYSFMTVNTDRSDKNKTH